jgi:hypothetical protein
VCPSNAVCNVEDDEEVRMHAGYSDFWQNLHLRTGSARVNFLLPPTRRSHVICFVGLNELPFICRT